MLRIMTILLMQSEAKRGSIESYFIYLTFLNKNMEMDFYDRIKLSCQEIFPKRIGKIIATEIAAFYYFFTFSGKPEPTSSEFTGYKKNGIRTTVGVFLFLLIVETVVVHIMVASSSERFAWVLTILGIYTFIQISAILKSLSRRFIKIDHAKECLYLRYGFAVETEIPFQQILRIEQTRKPLKDEKSYTSLSIFDMLDSHNIVITLRSEHSLHKIYGIQKKFIAIAIFVDEADRFITAINLELND